jgi:UDP-glucose 4-epimerase
VGAVLKILVTGGAGFIGSHIVDRLAGHEVVVVDKALSRDLLDVRAGDFPGLDVVVHCAAYADVRHNWDSPEERNHVQRNNVEATFRLLEAIPSAVPVVFLSTGAVYGSPGRMVTEKDAGPETVESPYAASKLACEALIRAYAHARKSPYYLLRLVNVVGARQPRGVIHDFVRQWRDTRRIHAADNGKQRKSWVHVEDVAEVVAKIVNDQWRTGALLSGTYNVTSQERISWWDVLEEMGVPLDLVTFEDRKVGAVGDPHDLHVSGEKLDRFHACRRNVRAGIRDALRSMGWIDWRKIA